MERCTKVEKGQEDDRNDKSQPNHSYVNLPQIKWDFLVYLIIFCVRSSSKRPLEESITWRKPRPKELRSAGFMAFCWLGGRHRRYRNMVQRHLNSHVKDFSHPAMNAGSVPNDTVKPWGQPTRALSVLLQTDHIGEVTQIQLNPTGDSQ